MSLPLLMVWYVGTPDLVIYWSYLCHTLRGSEAGAIEAAGGVANVIREADYIEYTQYFCKPFLFSFWIR